MAIPVIHVAAAAIFGADGRLLISRRPEHLHQGGLLEFPGGKVDPGELVTQALVRELQEELGISAESFRPLIRIPHDYPDKRVLLDVWVVDRFSGEPRGLEGQELYWLAVDELIPEQFPVANRPIISALKLPDQYLITGTASNERQWLQRLEKALLQGFELVQLRAHQLDSESYRRLVQQALPLCRAAGAQLIANRAPTELVGLPVDGVHLSRHVLRTLAQDAAAAQVLQQWRHRLIGASCHDAAELQLAQQLQLDYALLSPILPTASHPEAQGLGWSAFIEQIAAAQLPVYALGGMTAAMTSEAIQRGGQGVAAIGAFWGGAEY